jgi:hypothetical protein
MARIVTVRKKEGGGISVRCGSDIVGTVTQLEGGNEQMSGRFTRGAQYDKYARLLGAGDKAAREKAGLHIFSAVHDMRIDQEETLEVDADVVRFKPDAAFIVLRSGGLG